MKRLVPLIVASLASCGPAPDYITQEDAYMNVPAMVGSHLNPSCAESRFAAVRRNETVRTDGSIAEREFRVVYETPHDGEGIAGYALYDAQADGRLDSKDDIVAVLRIGDAPVLEYRGNQGNGVNIGAAWESVLGNINATFDSDDDSACR